MKITQSPCESLKQEEYPQGYSSSLLLSACYSQSAYNPSEEPNKETLKLLRLSNNDKNSTYELCLNTKFL